MEEDLEIKKGRTRLPGPLEGTVLVETVIPADDAFSSFSLGQHIEHYAQQGYTIARKIVPTEAVDDLVSTYNDKIKPGNSAHERFFTNNKVPPMHTDEGYLANPPKSVHNSPVQAFADASKKVLGGEKLQEILVACNNGAIKLGESVYFERAINTPGHQDAHYSPKGVSSALTAWVALEDIEPGAGRLWIQPGTHLESYAGFGDFKRSKEYFKALNADIDNSEIVAPALKKGDALIFSARTIHGSLVSTTPEHSRNALSGLFVNQ